MFDAEYVEVDAKAVAESAFAVLLDTGDDECWVPKSVMDEWPEVGETGTALIEEWFAVKEGLV